ncbi:hypothetical protein niasHT_036810 [Heterodera trifolii]|uniref:BTB domain-containing protein n=1 Tax=Heterodera trifolii TaxID=157864 RepID=A0ABD2IX41_9BILA
MAKLVIDRMKLILSSGEDTDVHFLLLPAHKLILKHASDVFGAMFRFDAKKEKAENVPDVEAAAFKVMLSFIYAGDLSELNGDNAMAVLYAAKKYNIPGLADQCLDVPISNLRNVFFAYAQTRLFDLEDFVQRCLAFIDKNSNDLLKSEKFLQIDQKLLCEILGRDELQIIEEISVWKAGIECSAENLRQMLGLALFKIRFPLVKKMEFSEKIDSNLCCVCSATFRIVSQKKGVDNNLDNSTGTLCDRLINKKKSWLGFNNFISYAELLDPRKGFYNRKEDKVKLAIDVTVK